MKEALIKRDPRFIFLRRVDVDPYVRDAIDYMILFAKGVEHRGDEKIQNEREALEELSRQFAAILSAFERAHPASILAGGSGPNWPTASLEGDTP